MFNDRPATEHVQSSGEDIRRRQIGLVRQTCANVSRLTGRSGPLCILCVNRRAVSRDTTFTEFTEAVSDNTDDLSKHRLSPYNAHCKL